MSGGWVAMEGRSNLKRGRGWARSWVVALTLPFWLLSGAALGQDAPPVTVVKPVPFEHAETLRFTGTLRAVGWLPGSSQ